MCLFTSLISFVVSSSFTIRLLQMCVQKLMTMSAIHHTFCPTATAILMLDKNVHSCVGSAQVIFPNIISVLIGFLVISIRYIVLYKAGTYYSIILIHHF